MPLTEAEARRKLQTLVDQYNSASLDERRGMSEASVVRQYIDRLLEEVLGWPIKDPQRYKYELHTQAGRPDMTLIPETGGTIFLEAKKFGVIDELREARTTIRGTITPGQLSLPGMAVDRTPLEKPFEKSRSSIKPSKTPKHEMNHGGIDHGIGGVDPILIILAQTAKVA